MNLRNALKYSFALNFHEPTQLVSLELELEIFIKNFSPPKSGQCILVMTVQTHIYTNGKVKSFQTLVTPKRKFINNKFGASRSEFQLQETFFGLT